jgi:hypothetical protein
MKQSNRQLLERSLAGERVDRPAYVVFDWFVQNRPVDWEMLFGLGLGQLRHANLVHYKRPHVEIVEQISSTHGVQYRVVTWKTDIGELREVFNEEWRVEHLIKSSEDYKILSRALSDTQITADTSSFDECERQVGSNGITIGQLQRTPFQQVQVDFAGLERFSFDIAAEDPNLMALLEMMADLVIEECRVSAASKAKHIKLWENLTIQTMGPNLYRRHLVPIYQKIIEIFNQAGKRLHVHYDGKLKVAADQIADLNFSIDSLTPPPEGDMEISEAREMWPEKFFWMHPCLGWFLLSEDELLKNVRNIIAQTGSRNYCLAMSEDIPANWRVYVPSILKMLNEME